METNEITHAIIAAAIKVHRKFGPGILESIYETCLAYELRKVGFRVDQQKRIPLIYDELKFKIGFRPDLIVDDRVIVEVKTVEIVLPRHKAQALSYARLMNISVALLINFNVECLKNGITRIVNNFH